MNDNQETKTNDSNSCPSHLLVLISYGFGRNVEFFYCQSVYKKRAQFFMSIGIKTYFLL